MKQTTSLTSFSQRNSVWLAQLDRKNLLLDLLELFDSTCVYLVDNQHQVLYWSLGMEKLTGVNQSEIIGANCLPDYVIDWTDGNSKKSIQLVPQNKKRIEAIKSTTILYEKSGLIHGGIILLTTDTELVQQHNAPKTGDRSKRQNFHGILSRSPAMKDVFQIIQNAAETEATVLVRGESGSGKELVAQAIHKLSARRHAPFLAINCAALSSNLLESELFGHVRGAFTGAVKDHSGLFQRANGGTLFLDEVAELPLELQAKLLRVLQERNYIPVGGSRSIQVDVRIVAATHRSLREEVKNGQFREDLMYRLRVVPIFLPPLRDRREDISLLIWHFIEMHNDSRVRVIEKIDPDAMKVLLDYRWPGNIRELHNVVEYAFAVGRGSTLRLSELPPEFREPRVDNLQKIPRKQIQTMNPADEAAAIRKALEQSEGQVSIAANLLGMSRATFWRKRKLYSSN
ncbi:MAG: sigma 54-interacting transcriptional regulator [Methylococcaceae bacterium]|nr:sigma 54-interacting transcriptional regulator [Methylococcaceae bacterium]